MSRPVVKPCGNRAAYVRGCRCAACREATRAYNARQRLGTILDTYLPVGPPPPGRWVDDAACRGADTNGFFPARGTSLADLRAICSACPVRADCLQWALGAAVQDGFWGGKSASERRAIRRAS